MRDVSRSQVGRRPSAGIPDRGVGLLYAGSRSENFVKMVEYPYPKSLGDGTISVLVLDNFSDVVSL